MHLPGDPRIRVEVPAGSRRRAVVHEDQLDRVESLPGGKAFAVTFDDGYQDKGFHAARILGDLALEATVYLVSAYIDSDRTLVRDVEGTYQESLSGGASP